MATSSGPMTSSIAVPARPKPGRKAAVDEPESKRKQQNRSAQRAFRERKQQVTEHLEKENKELKTTNDLLQKQILALEADVQQKATTDASLQKEIYDANQRATAFETKWNQVLEQYTAFQQRFQESEATIRQLQDEIERANVKIRALNTGHQQLTGSALNLGSKTTQHRSSETFSRLPVQTSAVVPQKRHLARDGCGDCEENGACPCVDSFVDEFIQPPSQENVQISRQASNGSISINSLLSPDSSRNNSQSQGDVPDLINDQSSPEELETDFTTQLQSFSVPATTRCGYCKDGDPDCLCAHEEALNGARALQVEKAPPMGPPQSKIKPGTCYQCQQNPEQKAYCESLALERQINHDSTDGQPEAKRSRRDRPNVTIQCSEAFSIYKRYSESGEVPKYEDVYKTFINSAPNSRRGTEVAGIGISAEKPRQFSAFETDIAGVIANLRHRGSGSAQSFPGSATEKSESSGGEAMSSTNTIESR
jgi:hypothetical protein